MLKITKGASSLHSKKFSKGSAFEDPALNEANIMLFCDIHGHSINDSIFMYGCKDPESTEKNYIKQIPSRLHQGLLAMASQYVPTNDLRLDN